MFAFLVFNTKKSLDTDVIQAKVKKYLPNVSIMCCNKDMCQVTYNEVEMTFPSMLSRHYFVPDDNWYLSSYMKILKELGVSDTGFVAIYTVDKQRILKTSKVITLRIDKKEFKGIARELRDCSIKSINSDDLLSKSCIYVEYNDYMLSELVTKEDLTNYVEKFNLILERQV